MSIVEIAITLLLADTGVNISFLRMLRLLRLLRLLKAWPGLYHVVTSFVAAVPQICNPNPNPNPNPSPSPSPNLNPNPDPNQGG